MVFKIDLKTKRHKKKLFKSQRKVRTPEQLLQDLLSWTNFKYCTHYCVYLAQVYKEHPQPVFNFPSSLLKSEKLRLSTFLNYPPIANKSAILLAQAGFFYIGSGGGGDDKVKCFFCGAIKENWRTSDVITQVHEELSPNCSIVTGIRCTNVPFMNLTETNQPALRQIQEPNYGVSSYTATSHQNPANHSVNEISEHRNLEDNAQESEDNTSSTRPVVQTSTHNVQQLIYQTPTSSPSFLSPQVSQADVSSNQNISTVVVSAVTGINCTNVSMTVPEKGNNLFFQLENSRDWLANEDERPKTGYGPERDAIETDSDHASGLEANQRHQSLSVPSAGNNRNVTPTHDARHFQLANQTVSKPSPSSLSASVQPAGATRQTQQQNSGISSSTVNSQRSPANHSVNKVSEHSNQADSAQESQNNTSSTRPVVQTSTQSVQQMLSPTPTSSHSTVSPQASQADVSSIQNISTVVVPAAPIRSAAVINITTSTTCSMNTDPPQGQGNTSQAGTGETQNNPRAAGKTPTYPELVIIAARPKTYEFATRAKRFESFELWPRDHHLRKEALADAGFYYAGHGDSANCFYCGGGLRNWNNNANVWVEHAKWYPKCAFIREVMGQPFIDTVQELKRSNDQITFEMVTATLSVGAHEPAERAEQPTPTADKEK